MMKRYSAKALLTLALLIPIGASFSQTPSTKTPDATEACKSFLKAFDSGRTSKRLDGRFPSPRFELYDDKATDGQVIYVGRDIPNVSIYITCNPHGSLASLDIEGPSAFQEDDNRLNAVIMSAIVAASPSEAEKAGDLYFEMFKSAETDLFRVVHFGNKIGQGERKLGNYSARYSLTSDRLIRFELAETGRTFLVDNSDIGERETFDEYQREYLSHWRCTPEDLHGSNGMMWVGPKKGEAMLPILPKGECTVRVQPSFLRRSPQAVRNRQVEMLQMKCFRQNDSEYRCLPESLARTRNERDNVMILARGFYSNSDDGRGELPCGSFEQALISRGCQFTIEFQVESAQPLGSMQIIGTEAIYGTAE
jgi:hypothetical protein